MGILTVGQLIQALQERGVEAHGQVVGWAFGQREGTAGDGGELWPVPTALPLRQQGEVPVTDRDRWWR